MSIVFCSTTIGGDTVFELGNTTYLANTQHPKATFGGAFHRAASNSLVPTTVIATNETLVTRNVLQNVLASYGEGDDVWSVDFLEALYISTPQSAVLDASAMEYLASMELKHLMLGQSLSVDHAKRQNHLDFITLGSGVDLTLPPGPYAASISSDGVSFATAYRLYRDEYRDFLFGAYESNDGVGNYNPVGVFLPRSWEPFIPVPSRIYSWGDDRPLAGERVAIKDLYDVKGLQTSGGSRAWAFITPVADANAPSVQQIIDLGGVIVGKQKLAQFASGANPWDWQEEHVSNRYMQTCRRRPNKLLPSIHSTLEEMDGLPAQPRPRVGVARSPHTTGLTMLSDLTLGPL